MLADEVLRVQVGQVQILELRAELLLQVVLCVARELPELPERARRPLDRLRQLVRAEQHDRDREQSEQLQRADIEERHGRWLLLWRTETGEASGATGLA